MKPTVTIELPPEFIELCERDQVRPETVLRGFNADLCRIGPDRRRRDGYARHGNAECEKADEYYCRVGYPYFPGVFDA